MPTVVFVILLAMFNYIPHMSSIIEADYGKRIQEISGYIILSSLWFSGAWIVNRLLDTLFFDFFLKQKLKVDVPLLIKNLSRLLIFFFAALGVISVVYSRSISGLLTATGAIGLVVGFALKNMISDVFDGVSLTIDKPFKVGDFIRFGPKGLNTDAKVVETTWRTTRFKSGTGGILVVPNSELYKMAFTNMSTVGAYFVLNYRFDMNAPVDRIKKLLVSAAISTPGVETDPPPAAHVKTIEKGNIIYALRFVFKTSERAQVAMKDAVNCKVVSLLSFLGFSFSLDKEQIVFRKTKAHENEIIALNKKDFIKQIPLFKSLTEEEYTTLSENIDTMKFKPNTNVIELDEQLACLYIIEEGLLSVHVKADDKMLKVAYLNTGSFFGEMSLLTGSKASATIVAENETTLFKVSKPLMKELFQNNPELIKSMSLIIAKRQAENSKRTAEIMSAEQLNAETKSIADRLVNSICSFFKI